MDKFLNQFRRLYDDKGANDRDFTEQETRLREAQKRLVDATNELNRSSQNLNATALSVQFSNRYKH